MVGAKSLHTLKDWNTQLDMELHIQEHVETIVDTIEMAGNTWTMKDLILDNEEHS